MRHINSHDCHVRFGKFIREGRLKKDLYQQELADMLGISQSYVSKFEQGERDIDLALAMKICEILDLDMKKFVDSFM